MAAPGLIRQWRRLRGAFDASAPRVVVRGHLSWWWQLLVLVFVACLASATTWLAMRTGDAEELRRDLEVLRRDAGQRQEELSRLRVLVGTEQSALAIEQAAQRQMLVRIAALEGDNAIQKEELLLLEKLLTASADEAVVRIESFRVLREGESRFRYRLLLACRPARALPEFRGRLQIAVTYSLDGKEHGILLPSSEGGGERVELKHFARREGGFSIPEGAALIGAEARLFQGERLSASKHAQL
ncbi:MAG: hypothetical protein FIB06_10250 [Betaproteobacteria bacterium]|nr:hypothetical protein [Betaproteobacteria bacterium]